MSKKLEIKLTESELDAIIVVVRQTRLVDIHLCRIVSVREALAELEAVQKERNRVELMEL